MARVAAAGALFSLAPPANLCTRGCTNSRTCRATPSNCSCHQPSTSGSTSCSCFNRVGFRVSFRGWHEPLLQCSNKAWERRVKVSQKTCSGNKWLWSWFSKNSLRDCFKVYAGDQPHPPPKPPMPLVGHLAPDFEAEAVFEQEFIKIKLSSYFGKKFVVLFFYPLDFTFVCPTEITQFSDRYDEFQKLNTEVIAISTDSVFSHLAWIQTDRNNGGLGELRYPIASDLTKSISRKYTVLISDQGVALRGLFILDKQGVIQHATVNNLAIGRSVDETIRTLQAIQHVQQNPDEVCAAGWQPGDKPLKQGKDYLK